MKRLLAITAVVLALGVGVRAEVVQKGGPFPAYTLSDPHGSNHTLRADTRFVLVASEMKLSKAATAWLGSKPTGFLEDNRLEYVSDITPMPGIISTLFAKPKMRKYPFRMLLAEDPAFEKTYPRQSERLALFVLDDQQTVKDIVFITKPEELEALLVP